jgi:hypothetical protein
MAAKIKLGNNPKTFEKAVDIILLNGDVAPLRIKYKYRTRSEFAKMVDEDIAAGRAREEASKVEAKDGAESKVTTIADLFAKVDEGSADYVLRIAEGWDLDDEFTKENLVKLEDENPGALEAISILYRNAVAEVRRKN